MELSFNVEQFVVKSALSDRQWRSWSIILECKQLGPRSALPDLDPNRLKIWKCFWKMFLKNKVISADHKKCDHDRLVWTFRVWAD